MRGRDTDELRALILVLHAAGLKPAEIAARVGCHRATVYKVLKAPAPDGRRHPGRRTYGRRERLRDARALTLAALRAAPGTAEAGGEGEGSPEADPYAGLADPDYAELVELMKDPEGAYARALLRQILRELKNPRLRREHRDRLVGRATALLGTFSRLRRDSRRPEGTRSQLLAYLDAVTRAMEPDEELGEAMATNQEES